jgi:hypothetical protein
MTCAGVILIASNLASFLLLIRNKRVSSFYWTRGSTHCFLTSFSYFRRFFLILGFLQNCYLLVSLRLSWLRGNQNSCLVFSYLWHYELVCHTCAPVFLAQNTWISRRSQEPGSRLTTWTLSPFRLLPKVSHANVHWAIINHTFLTDKNPQALLLA